MDNYNTNSSDDLDYLSDAGFMAMGHDSADTKWIRAKVRAQFGGSSFLTILASVLFLTMMTASFIVAVTPFDYPAPARQAAKQQITGSTTETEDTVPIVIGRDPIAKTANKITCASHESTAAGSHQSERTNEAAEHLTPESMPSRRNTASLPAHEREPSYTSNAPVTFIEGYKVTEYSTLYFRGRSHLMPAGLDASFSGDAGHIAIGENERPLFKILGEALALYKAGDYRACLYELARIREINKDDLNCVFYTAMCELHLGRCASAIAGFDRCITNRNNSFVPEAEYHKAEALGQCGNNAEARSLMVSIAGKKGFYEAHARRWLEAHERDN
jgi:hypothetical protein